MNLIDSSLFQKGAEIPAHLSRQIGNKALRLLELTAAGFHVPPFIVIPFDSLYTIFDSAAGAQLKERINNYLINKEDLFHNLENIQREISRLPLSKLLSAAVSSSCKEIPPPYAVRSSAIFEDSASESFAGALSTQLYVTSDVLVSEIVACYSSLFSESLFVRLSGDRLLLEDLKMGVVVQKMVQAQISGVLFTCNPVNSDSSQLLIEAAEGAGGVVDGGAVVKKLLCEKVELEDSISDTEDFPLEKDLLRQLCEAGIGIEKWYGAAQDVEWSYDGHHLFYLQCRPVTTVLHSEQSDIKYTPLHLLTEQWRPKMGGLKGRLDRWLKKKIPFFSACHHAGVSSIGFYIFYFHHPQLDSTFYSDVLSLFRSPYLFIAVNETIIDIHITKERLPEVLPKLIERCGGSVTMSIKESYPNEYSLLVRLQADKRVYIEVVPGAVKGLNSGLVQPSIYSVAADGRVTTVRCAENSECFMLNPQNLKIELQSTAGIQPLSEKVISQAALETAKVTKEMDREIVVEYWCWGTRLVATDVSLLNEKPDLLLVTTDRYETISPGILSGRILRFDAFDLAEAVYLSHGRGMSVLGNDPLSKELGRVKALHHQVIEFKKQHSDTKVILCVEKPLLIYSSLIEFVDGFIFQEASLLCHLSIILRERGIPAISLRGQSLSLQTGELYQNRAVGANKEGKG